jgi:hypothetical protein
MNAIGNKGFGDEISQWNRLDTEGDGSCLVHSILQLVSPTYRRMNSKDKQMIGQSYRRHLITVLPLNAAQRVLMLNVGQFLSDDYGEKIADYLGFGLIYLQETRHPDHTLLPAIIRHINPQLEEARPPSMVIYNTGSVLSDPIKSGRHYESVFCHDYLSPFAVFQGLERLEQDLRQRQFDYIFDHPQKQRPYAPPRPQSRPQYINQFTNCMKRLVKDIRKDAIQKGINVNKKLKAMLCNELINIQSPPYPPQPPSQSTPPPQPPYRPYPNQRCDTPKQNTKIQNSLSSKEVTDLAKIHNVYKKGDTKSISCRKLKEKGLIDWYDKGVKQLGKRSRRKYPKRSKRKNNLK